MLRLYKIYFLGLWRLYSTSREKRKGVTVVTRSLIGKKLLLFLVLALLVSDAAAGLASGLARGLALTAATVLCALAKVTSLDSFDMLHYSILQRNFFYYAIIQLFWA